MIIRKIKDKDPILEEKFFKLFYPLIHPNVSDEIMKHAFEQDMVKHRLYGSGKLSEAAISAIKGLKRHDTIGKDYIDGSDSKTSSVRWMSNNKVYSAPITDIYNKIGLLRCTVYERQHDKFYFFLIPREAYAHIKKSSNIEISFNLDGTPNRTPSNNTIINWWDFEVKDFYGILEDIILPFVNYKKIREQKRIEVEIAKKLKADQRKLKSALPKKHSRDKTKNLPNVQIPTLCMEEND
ncbi:MAG TPA: hypothetical protein VIY47_07675 [Ignavibacteriaceae bacterium]